MKKITKKMVNYWLSTLEDTVDVIQEIANSKADKQPWTPEILYNDIKETWDCKPDE